MKSSRYKQQGFMSVEFLFSLTATLGCLFLLLRVSMSLISVQIAQYIVFAAARAHAAGDLTEQEQIDAGENKYAQLLANKRLTRGLIRVGSQMQKDKVIGDFDDVYEPASGQDGLAEKGLPFVGARARMKLSRLGFSVPSLGSTADSGSNFEAYVNAMIFREPSHKECRDFFEESNRYNTLLKRDTRYGRARQMGPSNYAIVEDSGC